VGVGEAVDLLRLPSALRLTRQERQAARGAVLRGPLTVPARRGSVSRDDRSRGGAARRGSVSGPAVYGGETDPRRPEAADGAAGQGRSVSGARCSLRRWRLLRLRLRPPGDEDPSRRRRPAAEPGAVRPEDLSRRTTAQPSTGPRLILAPGSAARPARRLVRHVVPRDAAGPRTSPRMSSDRGRCGCRVLGGFVPDFPPSTWRSCGYTRRSADHPGYAGTAVRSRGGLWASYAFEKTEFCLAHFPCRLA
jgi:hypothetical protein